MQQQKLFKKINKSINNGAGDQKVEKNESEDENDQNDDQDLFGPKRKKQETLLDNTEWQSKFYDSLIGAEGGSDDHTRY